MTVSYLDTAIPTTTFRKKLYRLLKPFCVNAAVARELVRGYRFSINERCEGRIDGVTVEREGNGLWLYAADGKVVGRILCDDSQLPSAEPTDDIITLRDQMVELMPSIYDAIHGEDDATRQRLCDDYNALRDRALAINPYVHAGFIDPDQFSFYSDLYKERVGMRPRGYTGYAQMLRWLERDRAGHNDYLDAA